MPIESGSSDQPRQLVAVWFADIVGYSDHAARDEDAALRVLAEFGREAAEAINAGNGRLVKLIGDAALAEFTSTGDAASSALALMARMRDEHNIPLRIGLHVGEVTRNAEGDILGDGVNLASRLQTAALPGQVLASGGAWNQLRQRTAFRGTFVGKKRLKGQREPISVYSLAGTEPHPGGAGRSGRSEAWTGRFGNPLEATRARWVVSLVLLAVVVIAAGLWGGPDGSRLLRRGGDRPLTTFPRAEGSVDLPPFHPARLAVLYFDDHSPDGALGFLADGLTEGLIHELTQVPALDVISRNGVKPFRNGDTPLDSIVNTLQVGSLIEGSVAVVTDGYRLTVQLIDTSSDAHLASHTFDLPEGDLFALQDSVLSQVAGDLRQVLGREIRLRQTIRGTRNQRAWELVLRAKTMREDFGELRTRDAQAGRQLLLRADSLLALAEELDTRWSEPTVLRGWVARDISFVDAEIPGVPQEEWHGRMQDHAREAIRRQAGDPAAHELLGFVSFDRIRAAAQPQEAVLLTEAESAFRRAVELDPERARSWQGLSQVYLAQDRLAEANLAAQRALREDAFLENAAAVLHLIYNAALEQGPNEEAIQACNEGRRRFQDDSQFVLCQLYLLASFPQVPPDVRRAWALADSLPGVVSQPSREEFRAYGRMLVAQVAARAGMTDSARAIITLARGDSAIDWLAYNEAHARMLMGQPDSAIDLLRTYLTFDPDTAYLEKDWWFEDLRANADFARLLRP